MQGCGGVGVLAGGRDYVQKAFFRAVLHTVEPARHRWGPNSACDVGLPLELTSGLGRDRGESGGLRGVLVAPARHREKVGFLFMGIVGSGCARSRIVGLG